MGLEPASEEFGTREAFFWKRPAIPLISTLIAGILWGKFWPLSFFLVCALSGIGLAFLFLSLKKPFFSSATILPLALFLLLGHFLGLSLHLPEKRAERLHAFCKEETLLVTGRIHDIPQPKTNRIQAKLSDVVIENSTGERFAPDGLLSFTLLDPEISLVPGSLVRIRGKVKPFYNFENPGGFDYRAFQFGKNILGRISCKKTSFELIEEGGGNFSALVDRFRMAISRHIEKNVSNNDSAAILSTMLVGDKRFLKQEIRDAYARTGLGHLLAISGLHVGLLAGGLYFVLERLFRFIPYLLLRGWTRVAAVFPAIFFALSYALVSGGAPSALRAVVMTIGVFILLFLRKSTDLWSLLVLAGGFLLVLKPGLILDTGFLMSFSAVCGLILGFSKYPVKISKRHGFFGKGFSWIEGLLKTSFFAFLFTVPICLFVFRQIPMVGIAANLIMVPLMAMLALPVAMAGIFFSIVPGDFGNFLLFSSGKATDLGNSLCVWMAELPFACMRHITLTIAECALLYGFFLLWLGWKRGIPWSRLRILVACGLVLFSGLDLFHWIGSRKGPAHPLVLQMDVGQGASAVIRLPDGFVLLVDAGGFPWEDALDTGERILSPWLDMQRIRTIDALVLSHPHSDHGRGFFYLARNYKVKELWLSRDAMDAPMGRELTEILQKRGAKIRFPAEEATPIEMGKTRFRFLESEKGIFSKENDSSLVLRVETDSGSMLFTGDIERTAEEYYVKEKKPFLAADVLQVPHHGSRTSSTKAFIESVSPSFALISCGNGNIYRYPSADVLRRLEEEKAQILRTDQGGAIAVHFGDKDLEVAYKPIGHWDRLW